SKTNQEGRGGSLGRFFQKESLSLSLSDNIQTIILNLLEVNGETRALGQQLVSAILSVWSCLFSPCLCGFLFSESAREDRKHITLITGISWSEAVAYCRAHYTDLAMIEDEASNTKVSNARPAVNIWIGLSRKPWHWVDGSPLTFNSWQGGAPFNSGTQYCVVEDNNHKWMAAGCSNAKPFICHKKRQSQDKMASPKTHCLNSQTPACKSIYAHFYSNAYYT
uniref:C-type lectin domain-containing protein n=1 Tax=Neogobius melanostomus TaxID=47308 RepID=A0A8C6UX50_9GOBI